MLIRYPGIENISERWYEITRKNLSKRNRTAKKDHDNIRSKDTKIEITLRKALWSKGYRYRKNYKKLPGSPDICLTKYKIAIFCDGEFFHGKDWEVLKARVEKGNNGEYWSKKFQENMFRDNEKDKVLNLMGWTVIHFWGKDILRNMEWCLKVIEETIMDLKTSTVVLEEEEIYE